jgi:Mg/Co/Ni transporter MgtE
MIWRVMTGREQGWVFFNVNDKQQAALIDNSGDVEINVQYVGVDPNVIVKIIDRLENPSKYKNIDIED